MIHLLTKQIYVRFQLIWIFVIAFMFWTIKLTDDFMNHGQQVEIKIKKLKMSKQVPYMIRRIIITEDKVMIVIPYSGKFLWGPILQKASL